jgi:dienelactone hydrolase
MLPLDAKADLVAAVNYVKRFNNQPVVLLGSCFSASLCILAAQNNPGVLAVVALSPGEYFQPAIHMSTEMARIDKPVFIAASQQEYQYLQQMSNKGQPGRITLFTPEKGKGEHGSRALSGPEATRDEYWFALMMFFKKVTSDQ